MNLVVDFSLVERFAKAFTAIVESDKEEDDLADLEITLPVAFKTKEGFTLKGIKLNIMALDISSINSGLPNATEVAFLIPDDVIGSLLVKDSEDE